MRQIFAKVAERLSGLAKGLRDGGRAEAAKAAKAAQDERRRKRVELVKARPTTLEQRYQLLDHTELADEVFSRLKRRVVDAIETKDKGDGGTKGPQAVATGLIEAGRLAPGRPYFFFKPLSKKGWLFERSGAGWVVSRAEKIVAQDLFLRDGDPIDSVSLYLASDQRGYPRVRSAVMGGDLLSLAVYEQRVLQQVGLV